MVRPSKTAGTRSSGELCSRARTRRGSIGMCPLVVLFGAAIVALAPLVGGPAVAAPLDPVRVFYPAATCRDGILEIEVFNRERSRWEPHPEHPRIVGETCQEEDAGTLLNEIRIRCYGEAGSGTSRWRVGVSVWSPQWMQACKRPLMLRAPAPELALRIEAPRSEARISNARRVTPVRGAIELGEGRLAAHDLVLLLDLSPRIAAERRRFVEEVIAALGRRDDAIRVGVVLYSSAEEPELESPNASGTLREWPGAEAAVAIPLSADLSNLAARIEKLPEPRAKGAQAFPDALSLALDALGAAILRTEKRAALGHVIGFSDGRTPLPFGGGAATDPLFRRRLLEAATHNAEAPIAIHMLALGAMGPTPPLARTLARRAGARFDAVSDSASAIALLPKLVPPRLESLLIANLSLGVGAASLHFEPDGRFSAELPLAEGKNRFSVVARLEDGRVIREERVVFFDSGPVRDAWRRREEERNRSRIEIDVEKR